MTRLLIANDCPEQMIGQDADFSQGLALWSLRLLWHIKDDDIIILPIAPEPGHLKYIAQLLHVKYDSLRIIIAHPGHANHLSSDRLTSVELQNVVREAIAGRHVESVLLLTPDASVVLLARSLGLESKVPGAAFTSQGGGVLANSKSVFRIIAAGSGVPIPEGSVTNDPQVAEEIIANMLLNQHVNVIVKKDFAQGCRGNEVLSQTEGTLSNGGRRGLVLPNRAAIKSYINENWDWLTNNGHHDIILERYFPGSIAIFAEFNLSDEGVRLAGLGEMLAAPIADGQVIPPVGLSPVTVAEITESGYRLSAAMQTIGYRGTLSADAIVTPDARVLFSEYNGRMTGSTHIYSVIGEKIIGKAWFQTRVLLERRGWTAPSFQAAFNMLNDSGLAYNQTTRTGVILTGTFIPSRKTISYTIIAENLAAAITLEEQLHAVSPRAVEILTCNGEKNEIK